MTNRWRHSRDGAGLVVAATNTWRIRRSTLLVTMIRVELVLCGVWVIAWALTVGGDRTLSYLGVPVALALTFAGLLVLVRQAETEQQRALRLDRRADRRS